MDLEAWQVVLACIAACLGGGGLARILTVGAANRRTDAVTLAESYGHVIDRLEADLARQGRELAGLRDHITELLKLIGGRDAEILGLRAELAEERGESSRLRQRVSDLEAREAARRHTD